MEVCFKNHKEQTNRSCEKYSYFSENCAANV